MIGHLTPREQNVCDRVVLGFTNKEIARQLSIGPRTVEDHRYQVMRKYEVQNVAQLMRIIYHIDDLEPA